MAGSYDHIDAMFRVLSDKWIDQITFSKRHKRHVFGIHADEVLDFYNGPRNWLDLMGVHGGFLHDEEELPDPRFRISVNKAFEYVQIMGPALYYENPVRTVKPRMPVDIPPMFLPIDPAMYQALIQQEQIRVQTDGLRAMLLGAYLNWSPHETSLADEARLAIEESLIKGRSCLWTELYTPPNANFKIVRSYWDSVDNLYVDPDAQSWEKVLWIARRCVQPVWQVERDRGLKHGTLKANMETMAAQADVETNEDAMERRRKGLTNDLLVYYKIWSKMGIGGRLPEVRHEYRNALEMFGDYAYIEVAQDTPFILNLPPDIISQGFDDQQQLQDMVFARTAWPTPFWADGEWPVSCLEFTRVPNSSWPMPPLKAALGELKALNWVFSFLVGHISNSARDFIAVLKSASEELKSTLLTGRDLELIEIDSTNNRPINEIVQFLSHPPMNADIWKVKEAIEEAFDKRVGLTPMMYGVEGSTQVRSAEEAANKQQNMSVRPEDMAKQVETWQARVAAKEAVCARFHLVDDDIRPVLGDIGTFAWVTYVSTRDPQVATRQLEYQIEAGSTQKPNKNYEIQLMDSTFQALGQMFLTYSQSTGDVTPLNNLLSDYAKAHDLDPSRYQLQIAMPSPPSQQEVGGTEAVQEEPTNNPIPAG